MQQLIDRYCRFDRTGADGVRYQTTTAVALVENGLLRKIPAAIVPFVRPGPIAIVCDLITRAIAAEELDTLLQQAGWQVRDRRLVNAQGQRFEFEILLNTPSFERVALPYVQWLERLGMSVRVRTVDPAQYQTRIDAFDYDMTVDSMGQSLSPGGEQRDYFTCAKARENGSQNVPGICDPAIDELVELVVNAPDRAELVARTRALDRVLLWNHFVIPHWHIQSFRIAFDGMTSPVTAMPLCTSGASAAFSWGMEGEVLTVRFELRDIPGQTIRPTYRFRRAP
jgi:hypothetical protein